MAEQELDAADDDEAELPPIVTLLLEAGLYREFDLDGDWTYTKRVFDGPDLQFDAYCVHCEQPSTFKQFVGSRGGGAGTATPKNETWLEARIFSIEMRCQRKPKHKYTYILEVDRQAISKIGQSPSLATIASGDLIRFRKVLAKRFFQDLTRAVGLFAHGIGAGSFVYLRRIFEHILLEAAENARKDGERLEGFETMRMEDKIGAVAAHLPPEVVEAKSVYSILSAGIHALSEAECLALFPVTRAAIEFILDGHLATMRAAEHKRDLKKALGAAKGKIEAKTE